jgi:hypothetical protein
MIGNSNIYRLRLLNKLTFLVKLLRNLKIKFNIVQITITYN